MLCFQIFVEFSVAKFNPQLISPRFLKISHAHTHSLTLPLSFYPRHHYLQLLYLAYILMFSSLSRNQLQSKSNVKYRYQRISSGLVTILTMSLNVSEIGYNWFHFYSMCHFNTDYFIISHRNYNIKFRESKVRPFYLGHSFSYHWYFLA